MTYYELVKYIEDEKKAPRNNKVFEILNQDFKYEGDIKIRLSNHIVELISDRINDAVENLSSKINSKQTTISSLPIELNELKAEIQYCFNLLKLNILEPIREKLSDSLIAFIENAELNIKRNVEEIDNSELYTIIKNLNLKEGI